MKDPAFLFYPNDWMGGTMGMTFEEKGAYMELLILQFNRGHMSPEIIRRTVGNLWENIQDKFEKDENGKFFNIRLEQEKKKRAEHREKQRQNVLKRWNREDKSLRNVPNEYQKDTKNIPKSYGGITTVIPLENEDENRIRNRNKKKEGAGRKKQIQIDLPWDTSEFSEAWEEWKQFRKEKGWGKYVPRGEKKTLSQLEKTSGGDERTAIEIINQSITHEWKGLYEIKKNAGNTAKTGYGVEDFKRDITNGVQPWNFRE